MISPDYLKINLNVTFMLSYFVLVLNISFPSVDPSYNPKTLDQINKDRSKLCPKDEGKTPGCKMLLILKIL